MTQQTLLVSLVVFKKTVFNYAWLCVSQCVHLHSRRSSWSSRFSHQHPNHICIPNLTEVVAVVGMEHRPAWLYSADFNCLYQFMALEINSRHTQSIRLFNILAENQEVLPSELVCDKNCICNQIHIDKICILKFQLHSLCKIISMIHKLHMF